jgi:hypothetical protein
MLALPEAWNEKSVQQQVQDVVSRNAQAVPLVTYYFQQVVWPLTAAH